MDPKTKDVTEGCMIFIRSLIKQHYADPAAVYNRLTELCSMEAARARGNDPTRNR